MKQMAGITIIVLTAAALLQAQIQSNVLDASRQVGSGGYNQPIRGLQPGSTSNFGNLYITGNVTGGKQFRGYVPYTDPSQFQGTLGSNALNSFQRSSVDVQRVQLGETNNVTMPYYSQSSTILPFSAIRQNYNLPGSSVPRSQVLPQTPSYLTGATLSQSYTRALQKDLPTDIRPSDILIPNVATPAIQPGEELYTQPIQVPAEMPKPLKPEELEKQKPEEEPFNQPLTPEEMALPDQAAKKDFSDWLTKEAEQVEQTRESQVLVGPQKEYAESAKRLAVQGKAVKGAPGAATQPSPLVKPSGRTAIPVVSTLAGTGKDAFTRTMISAQKFMNQGRFYDAYYKYSDARSQKADDPLPIFGQANALLAAGDLRGAAEQLQTALEKFPKFLFLQMDGSRLLGSKSILNRRCDQVKNLLTKTDDPNLKFVAGYLQILAGNRDEGFKLINASGLLKKE